jgi:hypothetical protein
MRWKYKVYFTNGIRSNDYQIWLEVRRWKTEADLLLSSDSRLQTKKFVETESLALKRHTCLPAKAGF